MKSQHIAQKRIPSHLCAKSKKEQVIHNSGNQKRHQAEFYTKFSTLSTFLRITGRALKKNPPDGKIREKIINRQDPPKLLPDPLDFFIF